MRVKRRRSRAPLRGDRALESVERRQDTRLAFVTLLADSLQRYRRVANHCLTHGNFFGGGSGNGTADIDGFVGVRTRCDDDSRDGGGGDSRASRKARSRARSVCSPMLSATIASIFCAENLRRSFSFCSSASCLVIVPVSCAMYCRKMTAMATDTAVTMVDAIVTTVLADTPPLASTIAALACAQAVTV